LIRNDPKLSQVPTLEGWYLYQTCPNGTSTTCPSGTGRVTVPVGQVVLVPVGQARCLYQKQPHLDRERSKETCSCPMDRSYTHTGGLSLSQDRFYTHDGTCPSPTCPNLSHKVGLQGRGNFSAIRLRILFFAVESVQNNRNIRSYHRWWDSDIFCGISGIWYTEIPYLARR